MVHLLAYLPSCAAHAPVDREPITVAGVEVALRADGAELTRCTGPSREPLAFDRVGSYVRVTVPQVVGYQMVVFETSPA